jgi:hypothetical protein
MPLLWITPAYSTPRDKARKQSAVLNCIGAKLGCSWTRAGSFSHQPKRTKMATSKTNAGRIVFIKGLLPRRICVITPPIVIL